MIVMDKIAYSSKLLGVSPVFKAGLALSALVFTIAVGEDIFSAIVFVFMSFLCTAASGLSPRRYARLCLIPFWFLLLGAVTIAVSFGEVAGSLLAVPFFGSYIMLTNAGLLQALNMLLKSLACVSCLYFLYVTTPVSALLGLLDKIHTPKLITELMMMIYRFIFILINMAEQMLTAQQARLGGSSYRASLRSFSVLASSLFASAFQKSEQIYNSMESRGYSGEFAFTGELKPATARQKVIFVVYILVLTVAALCVKIL